MNTSITTFFVVLWATWPAYKAGCAVLNTEETIRESVFNTALVVCPFLCPISTLWLAFILANERTRRLAKCFR
jgi:hypothetical protein